jgi:hypothetical protein
MSTQPNGMNEDREWCYFDEDDDDKWDFCAPNLDYNKARQLVTANFAKKVIEIRTLKGLADKINQQILPITNDITKKGKL